MKICRSFWSNTNQVSEDYVYKKKEIHEWVPRLLIISVLKACQIDLNLLETTFLDLKPYY